MKNSKHIFGGLVIVLITTTLRAQPVVNPCSTPGAYTTIHANNIKAGLLNAGDLFWDLADPQFIPNPTLNGPDPSTIFAAGLWIAAVDPAGNLKLAASTYRQGDVTDYWAGPLNSEGVTEVNTCANWDRFFKVKGVEINAFLSQLPVWINNPDAAIVQHPNIMGWPGRGNPYFSDIWGFDLPFTQQGLAPFHDENSDGDYNPLQGDYPVVSAFALPEFVPAEIAWCVFNDQGSGIVHALTMGSPLQVEVQLTVWAFNCFDQPVLNNTLFTSHRIINRGLNALDSCFAGLWVDFDLGCPNDDYIGSAPDLNAFYAYNNDSSDGDLACVPNFGNNPPAQSVTFLNAPLDKFVYYNNPAVGVQYAAMVDPALPMEYYRYITGRWRDGSPVNYGGSGFQSGGAEVNHAFSGSPSDPGGWSMCTANLPYADRKSLGSTKFGKIVPGALRDLVTAWTYHPGDGQNCSTGTAFDDIKYLNDLYEDDFAGVCSGLTGNDEPKSASFQVFPNPAADALTLVFSDASAREIRFFATDGKLVRSYQTAPTEQTVLDISGLYNGTYYLQTVSEQSSTLHKILILH